MPEQYVVLQAASLTGGVALGFGSTPLPAGRLRRIRVTLGALASGAATFDINLDGASIFTSPSERPTIPAGQTSVELTGLSIPHAEGAQLSIDADAVPAGGLTRVSAFIVSDDMRGDQPVPIEFFVQKAYLGALEREPDNGELSDALDLLKTACYGFGFIDAARALLTTLFTHADFSAPTNEEFVTKLYLTYEGRDPADDVVGFEGWVDALTGGDTRANVRNAFAVSTEFTNRAALFCRSQAPVADATSIAGQNPAEFVRDTMSAACADSADLHFSVSDPGDTATAVLTTTGVTAGSYGDSTHVPVITVDAKGRVTSASQTAASGARGANPMTTGGDLIVGGSGGAETRLAKGADGTMLGMVGGVQTWVNPSGYAGDRPTGTPATIYLQDDFMTGGSSQYTFGVLGWAAYGAILPNLLAAEAGHPGIIQSATGTSNGTNVGFSLRGSVAFGVLLAAETFDVQFIVRLNTNDSSTLVRVGLGLDPTNNPPANGLYVEKLAADTSWFGVTRASSSQTRTAALAATSTSWVRLRIRRLNSTTIGFSINGGTETTATATIPTTGLAPFVQIINAAASNKTIDVDY